MAEKFTSLLAPAEEFESLLAPSEEFESLLAPQEEQPTISFESPSLTSSELTPLKQLTAPQGVEELITGEEPSLAFIDANNEESVVPPDQGKVTQGDILAFQQSEAEADMRAFFKGGPAQIKKDKAHRQAQLALSEEPLTRTQRFRLDSLTNDLDALDPERQVNTAVFIIDNFNAGLLGDRAITPRLPPKLKGAAGNAYQVAGALAHLSGFGVSLMQLNKFMSLPEFVPFQATKFPLGRTTARNALLKIKSTLKDKGAQRSFEVLMGNRKLAQSMIRSGLDFGAREIALGPIEDDLSADRIFDKTTRVARETFMGAAFPVGAKIIGKPLEKVLQSEGSRALAGQVTFGSIIGLAQPTSISIKEDPLGHMQERLGNAGMTGAMFGVNHALWRAFPATAQKFFRWRNKARVRKLTDAELNEGNKILEEIEELALKSKFVSENEFFKTLEPPPSRDKSKTFAEFTSEASPVRKIITKPQMVKTSSRADIPLTDRTPIERAGKLRALLESDPFTHRDGLIGFKREVKALGDTGAFKEVIKPPTLLFGKLAPIDVAAVKAGTYKSMVKGLLRGDDIAFLETNEFAARYDRLNEILYSRKGARTEAQRKAVNAEAFRKIKTVGYDPNKESDPVVRDIMSGVKRVWKLFAQEERKLGYTYNENEFNYVPEIAKTRAARNQFENERIKYATHKDVVSGEVFLPSALKKTGREGTIEDLFLQAKFRARAFSRAKNLSKPALEFSTKLDAMNPYIKPESQSQLNNVYNLLVRSVPGDIDRMTDNSVNGLLKVLSKATPFKNLVDTYGGPGVARRMAGRSGRLQAQSFFLLNPQFYIRNRFQVTQAGSLTGPGNMIAALTKKVSDFPELQKILRTDSEIAPWYQRTKGSEASIDAPARGSKKLLDRGVNLVVGRSHMSNVDGTMIAAFMQGRQKVAAGKWTPEQARQNLYWAPRLAQYSYDPVRAPGVFRTAIGRESLRFQSWGINKIFYLNEHLNRMFTGHTGFGAPLTKREQAYSVMQLLWEAGIPSIKQGIKSVSALQILDQMRAREAIPAKAAELGGATISLIEELADIFKSDSSPGGKTKAIAKFSSKAALTWTPGGNSLIKKFSELDTRGFEKTFVISPSASDYKEWGAAQQKKRRQSRLFRTERPKR